MSVLEDIDDSKRLKVMTVEYTVDESGEVPEPIVHVFARDEHGERHHVEVEGFHPYFYITFEEYLDNKRDIHNDRRVRDVDEEPFENGSRVTSMNDEPLVRIYTTVPKHVGDMREDFDKSWEGDVFFHNRFLISEDIYLGITTPHTGRVHVDDVTPTAPPEVAPHVFAVDIEVLGDDGMPSPKHASKPISAITSYSTYREEYVVWVLESDVWDERPDFESNLPDGVEDADIHVFESENRLLADFNSYVADVDPDLLTGWNSSADDKGKPFDYPYLINRSKNINEFGVEDWSPMGDVYTTRYGACACKGREFFDMLPAYDKTQTSQKRSYRLEYIAQEELGYGKEEISGFREAWEETPEDFIKYNIRDTQAVVEIMEQMDIIPLFDNLRRVTGALYGSCYNNIDMIDMLFLRKAQDEGLALPTSVESDSDWYHGAEVLEPEPGKHENIVYFDLASLYPYSMSTLNISPDSIIGGEEELEESDYSEDEAIVGYYDSRPIKYVDSATEADRYKDGEYKAIMRRKSDGGLSTEWTDEPEETPIYFEPKDEMGFISGVIDELVDLKYQYEGKLYEAVKRVTNSTYGVLGDSNSYGTGFRLFDEKLAECITMTGRSVLNKTAEESKKFARSEGYDEAEVIGGDSVPASEPVIVKDDDSVDIVPIEQLESMSDIEVWSDDGFTRVKNVIKKPNRKQLYTVRTKRGTVHVTEDHSLLDQDLNEVSPEQVDVGDKLLHDGFDGFESGKGVSQDRAWLLGLFCAEGTCGIYGQDNVKYSWAINNQDGELLDKAQNILEDEFTITTKVDDVMESSNTKKLRTHYNDDHQEIVSHFRDICYVGQQKKVPKKILNADEDAKRAFLQGYHDGDGYSEKVEDRDIHEVWSKSETLMCGVELLMRELGMDTTVSYRRNYGNEYHRTRQVSFYRSDPEEIQEIEKYRCDDRYVYDLETESNHFHAGIGSIIVHNTDASMLSVPSADGREETLDLAFDGEEYICDTYDDFMKQKFNVDEHEMDVEVESYAETCFFSRGKKFIDQPGKATKKRYAQRITWDEDDGVIEDPDPDVAGFDLVRSNTSEITAEVQEEVLRLILESDEPKDEVYEYLEEVHEKYMDGEYGLEKIGRPKAISSKHPDEYGYEDPPKTPQPHIRGAKYATKNIRGEDIGKGSKPLLFHIDDVSSEYPQTYTADTLEDGMEVDSLSLEKTENFPDAFDLDYETQFGKTVKSKLKAILVTMGWSWSDIINPGRQQDISKFM